MKKLIVSLGGAVAVILIVVASVAAAGPRQGAGAPAGAGDGGAAGGDVIAAILNLSQEQIAELRQEGKSLAQIAEGQGIDPQKLIDALVAQWTVRIDARVANGALSAAEAATLRAELLARAKGMVYQATPGGMQGAAVGAGPAAGRGRGPGANGSMGQGGHGAGAGLGTGVCDGTGPNGGGQG